MDYSTAVLKKLLQHSASAKKYCVYCKNSTTKKHNYMFYNTNPLLTESIELLPETGSLLSDKSVLSRYIANTCHLL